MTQLGSDGDDWELLQHNHDVLSGSDTEPTSESESESRAASAIIEALEETPQANLQGISLGSLPQFLGGWYGSSPPAAGRTFSVDLSQVSTPDPTSPSQPGSPVTAAVDTAASDDFEDPIEDLTAPQTSADTEEQQGAVTIAAHAAPLGSSNSTADPASEPVPPTIAATPVCQAGHAARYCLMAAAALATLLLLLACSTGSPSPMSAPSVQAVGAAPAWHTTSTDSYKPVGTNRRHVSVSLAMQPTAAAPAASAGSSSAAGRTQPVVLPWWLRDEAGSALRRGSQGTPEKLPSLPPQWSRANMSASQRLRLHLWLLHCAARNSSITQGLGRGQAATYPAAFTPYTPLQSLAAPARPRAQPSPCMHQCRPSGTVQQWLTSAKPAGHKSRCPAAPATPMHTSTASQPATASNISCPAAAARPVAPPPVPTPLARAPCAPWACAAAPPAPHMGTPAPPTSAPPAHMAAAAGGNKATPLVTVQPTRPVPPMYRPPLPCLLLGGWRANSTVASTRPRQASAQQHNLAAPAGRTKAWPNATARHQQGVASAGPRVRFPGRSSKPYGRALAMGMARWGWHQPAGRIGICGPPLSLPMLPPVSQKGAGSSGSDRLSTGSSAVRGGISGNSWAGLSLPMLPPVACAAAAKTQQQQQPGGVTLPMLPPVTPGGLTLPMLPPVSEGARRQEGRRAGACAMHCGEACGNAEACGSVCVERCAGMPPLYVAIPTVTWGPSHSTHASLRIPLPPVEPAPSPVPAAASAGKEAAPAPISRRPSSEFTAAAAAAIPLSAAQATPTPTGTQLKTAPVNVNAPSCPAVAAAALPLSLPAAMGPSTPPARPVAAGAACTATPAWALLMPSAGRVCANNGTALEAMLGAAAKLAAAAADLASAAADLATAAASLSQARSPGTESCRSPPLRALMGCKFERPYGGALFAARPAANDTRVGSARGVQEADSATKWVASLVTLPMLPPSQEEQRNAGVNDHDTDAERDAESIEGTREVSGCVSSTTMVTPFGPLVSCNSSGEASRDITSDNDSRRQPLWLAPVM